MIGFLWCGSPLTVEPAGDSPTSVSINRASASPLGNTRTCGGADHNQVTESQPGPIRGQTTIDNSRADERFREALSATHLPTFAPRIRTCHAHSASCATHDSVSIGCLAGPSLRAGWVAFCQLGCPSRRLCRASDRAAHALTLDLGQLPVSVRALRRYSRRGQHPTCFAGVDWASVGVSGEPTLLLR